MNAYGKIDGQAACCSPAKAESRTGLPIAASGGCCGGGGSVEGMHAGLAELLKRYDINDYAASVKVYAVKGGRR